MERLHGKPRQLLRPAAQVAPAHHQLGRHLVYVRHLADVLRQVIRYLLDGKPRPRVPRRLRLHGNQLLELVVPHGERHLARAPLLPVDEVERVAQKHPEDIVRRDVQALHLEKRVPEIAVGMMEDFEHDAIPLPPVEQFLGEKIRLGNPAVHEAFRFLRRLGKDELDGRRREVVPHVLAERERNAGDVEYAELVAQRVEHLLPARSRDEAHRLLGNVVQPVRVFPLGERLVFLVDGDERAHLVERVLHPPHDIIALVLQDGKEKRAQAADDVLKMLPVEFPDLPVILEHLLEEPQHPAFPSLVHVREERVEHLGNLVVVPERENVPERAREPFAEGILRLAEGVEDSALGMPRRDAGDAFLEAAARLPYDKRRHDAYDARRGRRGDELVDKNLDRRISPPEIREVNRGERRARRYSLVPVVEPGHGDILGNGNSPARKLVDDLRRDDVRRRHYDLYVLPAAEDEIRAYLVEGVGDVVRVHAPREDGRMRPVGKPEPGKLLLVVRKPVPVRLGNVGTQKSEFRVPVHERQVLHHRAYRNVAVDFQHRSPRNVHVPDVDHRKRAQAGEKRDDVPLLHEFPERRRPRHQPVHERFPHEPEILYVMRNEIDVVEKRILDRAAHIYEIDVVVGGRLHHSLHVLKPDERAQIGNARKTDRHAPSRALSLREELLPF